MGHRGGATMALVTVARLGHVGLIAEVIKDRGLIEMIDTRLVPDNQEEITPGEAVAGMLLNGLGFANRPLSLTPPFFATRFRTASETLRVWSLRARAEECDAITGAVVMSSTSFITFSETCEISINIPSLFISRTTSLPKSDSPLFFGVS